MKIKNIILISIIFISGCMPTTYYEKPNESWTNQEFYRDNAECLALCGQAGGSTVR